MTPVSMVFVGDISIVHRAYKLTYKWGGSTTLWFLEVIARWIGMDEFPELWPNISVTSTEKTLFIECII